jgi:hypothetical protein
MNALDLDGDDDAIVSSVAARANGLATDIGQGSDEATLLTMEGRAEGAVDWRVIKEYVRVCGTISGLSGVHAGACEYRWRT